MYRGHDTAVFDGGRYVSPSTGRTSGLPGCRGLLVALVVISTVTGSVALYAGTTQAAHSQKEPNDSRSTAEPVSGGQITSTELGTASSMTGNVNTNQDYDEDWFSFSPPDTKFVLTVESDPNEEGDIGIDIEDGSGTVVASNSTGDNVVSKDFDDDGTAEDVTQLTVTGADTSDTYYAKLYAHDDPTNDPNVDAAQDCGLNSDGSASCDANYELYLSYSPTAAATTGDADGNVLEGESVSFDASGTTDPDDQQSSLSFNWAFGDGASGSGVAPTHALSTDVTDGTEQVTSTVTVTDPGGGQDTATTGLTVYSDFDGDGKADVDNPSPSDIEGDLDDDNDGTLDAVDPRPYNAPPIVRATASRTTVVEGESVSFDASGTTDPDNTTGELGFTWRFSDDLSSPSGQTVTHTFTASTNGGNETVDANVTVTDGSPGNTNRSTVPVVVQNDFDGDGLPDFRDDDNDGVPDAEDGEPYTPNKGTITGTVTDSAGTPVTSGTVSVHSTDYQHYNSTSLAGSNTFSLSVPAGTYELRATTSDAPDAGASGISVSPDATTDVSVTFDSTAHLNGTVTNASGPVPQTSVLATSGSQTYVGTTDKTGEYNITVAPGNYTVTVLSSEQGSDAASASVRGGATATADLEVKEQTVTATGVSLVSGPGSLSQSGHSIETRATVQNGMLQVQLVNASETYPAGRVGAPSELEEFGVTRSTEFEITVTVTNYTANSLFWGLRNASVQVAQNRTDPNATDVTISGSPVTMQATFSNGQRAGPLLRKTPSDVTWPSGSADDADDGFNQTVYVGVFDLSTVPASTRSTLRGVSVTTNAQRYSTPTVVNDTLRVWVAGPSRTVSGADHTGFYQATIPDTQLDAWGVTNPESDLQALYKGSSRDFEVTETPGGARIELTNIDYSAGFVDIGADTGATDGPTGDVEVTDVSLAPTTVETGEPVVVNATVENTRGSTAAKTLRLRANHVPVDRRTVYVSADTTNTYQLSYTPSRTGEFDVTVNRFDAGTLAVTAPAAETDAPETPAPTPTPTPTPAQSTPTPTPAAETDVPETPAPTPTPAAETDVPETPDRAQTAAPTAAAVDTAASDSRRDGSRGLGVVAVAAATASLLAVVAWRRD